MSSIKSAGSACNWYDGTQMVNGVSVSVVYMDNGHALARTLGRCSLLLGKARNLIASYSIAALDVAGISKLDRKFYLKRSIQIERDKAQRRSNNLININRFVRAAVLDYLSETNLWYS